MTGRIIDPSHLVLQRTMAWGRQAYRQGVLLDVARLGDWLSEQGLGDDGLADYASVSFATPFGEGETHATGSEFVYRHRFGEPFDDLTARLELRPLPGAASAAYVYALAALLLASVVFGLGALYRMVSVMVGYAERRSNFVAAVSHELKTPLTAIRMYGEMLQGGMVASEAKREEYYGHITAESERLSRLINNVLELARLENGRPRTSGGSGLENTASTTGSPAPVVREVAALLGPHARERGFALDVRIDEGLPPVRFERDALVQMLCNLVDNALKYAGDAAEKRITLCCRRAGSGVSVGVRDRGTGVPPRHLGKIFEPFYRGERELTRTGKGVGLGLALVRGLAERMGARVDGRNASDGGFEVEILLGP
jgi:signal transduction histidine kinase